MAATRISHFTVWVCVCVTWDCLLLLNDGANRANWGNKFALPCFLSTDWLEDYYKVRQVKRRGFDKKQSARNALISAWLRFLLAPHPREGSWVWSPSNHYLVISRTATQQVSFELKLEAKSYKISKKKVEFCRVRGYGWRRTTILLNSVRADVDTLTFRLDSATWGEEVNDTEWQVPL